MATFKDLRAPLVPQVLVATVVSAVIVAPVDTVDTVVSAVIVAPVDTVVLAVTVALAVIAV